MLRGRLRPPELSNAKPEAFASDDHSEDDRDAQAISPTGQRRQRQRASPSGGSGGGGGGGGARSRRPNSNASRAETRCWRPGRAAGQDARRRCCWSSSTRMARGCAVPPGENPPVYRNVDRAQVERLAREVLDLPERHAALRFLSQTLPSLRNCAAGDQQRGARCSARVAGRSAPPGCSSHPVTETGHNRTRSPTHHPFHWAAGSGFPRSAAGLAAQQPPRRPVSSRRVAPR